MARIIAILALLVAAASAFAPHISRSTASLTRSSSSQRFMFNAEEDAAKKSSPPSLETAENGLDAANPLEATSSSEPTGGTVVKDMNTGEVKEVKWVDPAMRANTNPFEMSWWAYLLFGTPFVLLADDVFHFLPEGGMDGLIALLPF